MNQLTKACLSTLALSTLLLTGCQNFPTKSKVSAPQQQNVANQFMLKGKIGIRTPQQSSSAFFIWHQQQENFEIELSGALGLGKTQIIGKPGQVSLDSAKTGLIRAATPEELLERATGWQAPITHIVSWVQARPATLNAQTQQDTAHRITHIVEDGWDIDLYYQDEQTLPNKLIFKQQLEDHQENRITMIIQNR